MAKKVLIVDDEPDILRAAKVRLISFGYEVITAGDGNNIVNIVQKDMPDLILLDLRLPRMDGDKICAMLKTDDRFKHIPIILFTASVVHAPMKADKLGVDDLIIKPFEPDVLLYKIKKIIG